MTVLTALISSAALFLLTIILYLYLLGLNGIRVFRKKETSLSGEKKRFLVLIPAHNEQMVIKRVIDSIRDTDYDQDLVKIVIIADNCSDSTVQIVKDCQADVLERIDQEKIGKGYAIEWALNRLDYASFDAVTVIDADNCIEKNYFKVKAGFLDSGLEIIQAYYGYYNPSKTPYAYILYLANLIENELLYHSRSNLKLHTFLRGSGMTFKSSVLQEVPWHSDSVTEDVNYSIELILNDKKVHFTTQTKVCEEALSYIDQSFNQRLRYNTGIISLFKNSFLKLFSAGLSKGDLSIVESAMSFFLLSKPLLLSASMFLLLINYLVTESLLIYSVTVANIALISFYFMLGLFLNPKEGPIIRTCLASPFYGFWLIAVYVLSSFGYKKGVWSRTPRATDPKKHPPIL